MWSHNCHCSAESNASPVPILIHINPIYFYISYFFNFNSIPYLILGPPSTLTVYPPQLCVNLSSNCDKGFIQLIPLCSIYTVPSVDTFCCNSCSTNPSHQTHSPTYRYSFKRTVACNTLNSGLTE